jgi:hypothetical protein
MLCHSLIFDYRGMVSTITKQYETTKLKNKLIETNESNKKRQRGNQNPSLKIGESKRK